VIAAAGGSAALVGYSGTGKITLEATARGLAVTKLALWEPALHRRRQSPSGAQGLGPARRRVGVGRSTGRRAGVLDDRRGRRPVEAVVPMRQSPFWAAMEPNAHMLVHDAALLGDFTLPAERLTTVAVRTLVLDGGEMPWLSRGVGALVEVLPNAQHRPLAGQPHGIAMDVLAAEVIDSRRSWATCRRSARRRAGGVVDPVRSTRTRPTKVRPTAPGCGVAGSGRGSPSAGWSRRRGWDGSCGRWSGRCRG
jgi:hypothetical protein